MNLILSCPICGKTLVREEKRYACAAGHSFDIARQGYVNLLVGKNAKTHGDNAQMIASHRAPASFLRDITHRLPRRCVRQSRALR